LFYTWYNYGGENCEACAKQCGANQEFGMVWVDFSLRFDEVEDLLFAEHPTDIKATNPVFLSVNCNEFLRITPRNGFPFMDIYYQLAYKKNNAALFILRADGKIVNSYTLNSASGTIKWSTVERASGAYIIKMRNGNRSVTQRTYHLK
jgi:hypothetical protein